jgi:hypothetical protein
MDPFTIALATFGVQKLRGKSTKRSLRDAFLVGGGSYALGQTAMGAQMGLGQGPAFSSFGLGQSAKSALPTLPKEAVAGAQFRDAGYQAALSKGAETASAEPTGIMKLFKKAKDNPVESALIASTVLPLLGGEEEAPKPMFTEDDYKEAYKEQSQKLQGGFEPVANAMPSRSDVYGSNMFYANQGGLATAIPKYNQGGVNYLPSKIDHNENDVNNYVRAEGYVEDGAGAGDKDEDTMLAQLADGEFVSRADAVLGAGILSGADPKSFKNMRKAGADFFYDQQKKFKRIYDIVNASKQN